MHMLGTTKVLLFYSQGKYDEAIQAYNKAIEIDPQDAYAWNNKGVALKSLGHTTESNEAFAKAKDLGYTG
jgi:Flp pilus assembly protein TadD